MEPLATHSLKWFLNQLFTLGQNITELMQVCINISKPVWYIKRTENIQRPLYN